VPADGPRLVRPPAMVGDEPDRSGELHVVEPRRNTGDEGASDRRLVFVHQHGLHSTRAGLHSCGWALVAVFVARSRHGARRRVQCDRQAPRVPCCGRDALCGIAHTRHREHGSGPGVDDGHRASHVPLPRAFTGPKESRRHREAEQHGDKHDAQARAHGCQGTSFPVCTMGRQPSQEPGSAAGRGRGGRKGTAHRRREELPQPIAAHRISARLDSCV
jgi:hypothetical protein